MSFRNRSRNFSRNHSRGSSSPNPPTSVFTTPDHLKPLDELKRRAQAPKDVILKVGDFKAGAHREVLSNSSPKLKAMLSEVWDPEKNRVCELDKDFVNPDVVKDLLKVFYTGKVIITTENAQMLCLAASYLDIPLLHEAAKDFLNQKLQPATVDVLEWLRFSAMFELKTLGERCKKLICFSYDTVFNDEKLLAVNFEYLRQLFTNLNDPDGWSNMMVNEEMVRLLIRWINEEPTTRSESLNTLFAIFPLLELSENFLKSISANELIKSSDCLELVNKALDKLSLESQDTDSSETETLETSSYDLYCLGGRKGSLCGFVSRLNVSTGEWSEMAPMIYPRKNFSVVRAGNKIYCFGGSQVEEASRNLRTGISNVTQVYDTQTNRWTQVRSMPHAREESSAVLLHGCIYVNDGYTSRDHKSTVFRYCIATNQWNFVERMPMIRQSPSDLIVTSPCKWVSFKDYIYEFREKRTQRYDPKTDEWKIVTEPQFKFELDEVIVHQGKIYSFENQEMTVYDPVTNTTETLEDADEEEETYHLSRSMVSIGGKIWAVETYANSYLSYFDSEEPEVSKFVEYDPATNEWKELDFGMKDSRKGFHAVAIKR